VPHLCDFFPSQRWETTILDRLKVHLWELHNLTI
jgi:hypothetical protein